eukprot:jgi/Chrpa1/21554/Chrysochromulina_OHIO_Genome00022792-RA
MMQREGGGRRAAGKDGGLGGRDEGGCTVGRETMAAAIEPLAKTEAAAVEPPARQRRGGRG